MTNNQYCCGNLAMTHGVMGSVPELVDPVSVYCDRVRIQVGSEAQCGSTSKQLRPSDTHRCCWVYGQASLSSKSLRYTMYALGC